MLLLITVFGSRPRRLRIFLTTRAGRCLTRLMACASLSFVRLSTIFKPGNWSLVKRPWLDMYESGDSAVADIGGLTSNEEILVEMAVCGYVTQPSIRPGAYLHSPDGKGVMLPGMFGITYNARAGDRAFGWAGDHVEPGVSIDHPDEKCHFALHYLTCIGNEAVVTSGLARGAKGIVTGEHARLLVDFPKDVAEKLNINDQIQI